MAAVQGSIIEALPPTYVVGEVVGVSGVSGAEYAPAPAPKVEPPARLSSQGRVSQSSAAGGDDDTWYEYEDVLAAWEKKVADVTDKCARKVCPFKRCLKRGKSVGKVSASDSDNGHHHQQQKLKRPKHLWWEGLREDVPERYQRWEGIRERNTILSILFGLTGWGRKQPNKFERIQLFILYASVWYLAYTMSLRRRGRPCRKAWVEACVPTALGGGCEGGKYVDIGGGSLRFDNCSSAAVLAQAPDGFNDFESMKKGTKVGIDIYEAKCVKAGNSPCEIPICITEEARKANKGWTCEDKADGIAGFCSCNPWGALVLFDTVVYTVLFKLLYMPFWYLFVVDLAAKCGSCGDRCCTLSVVPLYVIIFAVTVVILRNYMDSEDGLLYETMWWFLSFCCLCLFEVVKAFTLGFLMGSYVIRPVFGPYSSAVWQFLFA